MLTRLNVRSPAPPSNQSRQQQGECARCRHVQSRSSSSPSVWSLHREWKRAQAHDGYPLGGGVQCKSREQKDTAHDMICFEPAHVADHCTFSGSLGWPGLAAYGGPVCRDVHASMGVGGMGPKLFSYARRSTAVRSWAQLWLFRSSLNRGAGLVIGSCNHTRSKLKSVFEPQAYLGAGNSSCCVLCAMG